VISTRDPKRGESVKALVVLKAGQAGLVSEADVVAWAHDHMAVYKSPRVVEFVASLPKSATGKVQWRELQELENKK
jgi:fatty-acyl-CoA synthase